MIGSDEDELAAKNERKSASVLDRPDYPCRRVASC